MLDYGIQEYEDFTVFTYIRKDLFEERQVTADFSFWRVVQASVSVR